MKSRFALVTLVLGAALVQPAPAQDSFGQQPLVQEQPANIVTNEVARQEWQRLYSDGQKALDQGNYPQAEYNLQAALTKAQEIGISGPVAMTMYNLGKTYQNEAKNVEAEDMFKKALEIYDSSSRRNKGILQSLIKDYAKLLRDTNRMQEAAELEARVHTPGSGTTISP